ncbi:MAG: HupE/UreJ family protein [Acidobacteria bacterium]|nr:HupE/UreJ family protein [Acidobacteriota bacterium]
MRRLACLGWLVLLLSWVPSSSAHPVAPALLKLHETPGGEVAVTWKQPPLRGAGALEPTFDGRCPRASEPVKRRLQGELVESWTLDCATGGLAGTAVTVSGLDEVRSEVLVFATLADGTTARGVLRPGEARWVVPVKPGPFNVAGDYLRLGVEHILEGADHLLFVLGLILLVRGWKRLALTVTGFTLGHSVTLALATLGWIRVPSGPVEVAIAASIFVLAVELTRDAGDLVHRKPWLVAAVFGLLHGLGFAGALAEVGLPKGEIPLALLTFNVGIELGQLLFVGAVLLVTAVARPLLARLPAWTERVPPYVIGSLAAYWVFERIATLV